MLKTKQQENAASTKMKLLIRGMATYAESSLGKKEPDYISSRAAYIAGFFKGYDDLLSEDKKLKPAYTQAELEGIAIRNYSANQETIEEEKDSKAIGFTFGYLAGYTLSVAEN